MYQIFVVEDELLIRQNIRNMVEKMQGPYAFCGEASDGEMALSMIQELMPDILLTDIRMPFLDGLGLIRHAKALMPWLKVAIISGYGDFEYAQKAISLGVDQYLLKPVRQAELVQAVEAMAAQIEKTKAAGSGMPGGMTRGRSVWRCAVSGWSSSCTTGRTWISSWKRLRPWGWTSSRRITW